jgi:hypothetical protein
MVIVNVEFTDMAVRVPRALSVGLTSHFRAIYPLVSPGNFSLAGRQFAADGRCKIYPLVLFILKDCDCDFTFNES